MFNLISLSWDNSSNTENNRITRIGDETQYIDREEQNISVNIDLQFETTNDNNNRNVTKFFEW